MPSVSNVIFYIFAFMSVYVQVFYLITFLENRKKIVVRKEKTKLSSYPEVTVIVPGFNEEHTIYNTVQSILNLNYPKDKLKILLVDDGSTDDTFSVMEKFTQYPNVKAFHKENGGKFTALNLGLSHTDTEFVGCLDADSVADPESLARIMSYFEQDKDAMAVVPSIVVLDPKSILEHAQKAEYHMAVYTKKMLSFLGAIFATPGPFTIFRKKVFDDLGPYRHAHNSEDMELACRMQQNYYKIELCNDAYVYTTAPKTIPKLYRQRLRWMYGFINNTIDYKSVLFRRKFGNFALFTLPAGIFSILAVGFLFFKLVYNAGNFIYSSVLHYQAVGFEVNSNISPDLFFLNTKVMFFVFVVLSLLIASSMILGRKMAEDKWTPSFNMLLFFCIFSLIGPFWVLKAIWSTALSRKPAWR